MDPLGYNLLITLLTTSHEPLSSRILGGGGCRGLGL